MAVGAGPVEGAAGGDVERAEVTVAERAVGGAIFRDGVRFDHAAGGGKDVDQRAGAALLEAGSGDDVAGGVEAHAVNAAVRAEVVQDAEGAERIVVEDGVGAELAERVAAVSALRDVERALIGGDQ